MIKYSDALVRLADKTDTHIAHVMLDAAFHIDKLEQVVKDMIVVMKDPDNISDDTLINLHYEAKSLVE